MSIFGDHTVGFMEPTSCRRVKGGFSSTWALSWRYQNVSGQAGTFQSFPWHLFRSAWDTNYLFKRKTQVGRTGGPTAFYSQHGHVVICRPGMEEGREITYVKTGEVSRLDRDRACIGQGGRVRIQVCRRMQTIACRGRMHAMLSCRNLCDEIRHASQHGAP